MSSTGEIIMTCVPFRTTIPSLRNFVPSKPSSTTAIYHTMAACGSVLEIFSTTSSRTRLDNWSNPFNTPTTNQSKKCADSEHVPLRCPDISTRILTFMYRFRSIMLSRGGLWSVFPVIFTQTRSAPALPHKMKLSNWQKNIKRNDAAEIRTQAPKGHSLSRAAC